MSLLSPCVFVYPLRVCVLCGSLAGALHDPATISSLLDGRLHRRADLSSTTTLGQGEDSSIKKDNFRGYARGDPDKITSLKDYNLIN